MSLDTLETKMDVVRPRVLIDVIKGPPHLMGAGTVLSQKLCKFQYVKNIEANTGKKEKYPKFIMEFDNTDGAVFSFALLLIGLELKIQWGYKNLLSKPYRAVVKFVNHTASYGGRSGASPLPDAYGSITMEAKAADWKPTAKPDKDAWRADRPMAFSEAARQIAAFYGYAPDAIKIQEGLGIFDTGSQPEDRWDGEQIMEGETAIDFLTRRAKERGLVVEMENGEFRLSRPGYLWKDVQPLTYFYGPDILTYSVDGNYVMNTQKVNVRTRNPTKGGNVHYVTTTDGNNIQGIGTTTGTAPVDNSNVPETISPEENITCIEYKAAERGIRQLVAHAGNKFRLRMAVVGNPLITTNTKLVLNNFGVMTDGEWRVLEAQHDIDNEGYTTRIIATCKKAGKGGSGLIVPVHYVINEKTGAIIGIGGTVASIPKGKQKKKKDLSGTQNVKFVKHSTRTSQMVKQPRGTDRGSGVAAGQ